MVVRSNVRNGSPIRSPSEYVGCGEPFKGNYYANPK